MELAREGDDDEHLAAIDRSLSRIETILEETLELARQGQDVVDPEPVAIATAADRCLDTLAADGVTVSAESFTVIADPPRLQQLLENLVRNSAEHGAPDDKWTDGGQSQITVRVGRFDGGFYVADDGHGIPESERDAVLEPGHTSSPDGTGFGLAIVTEIAEAHGWDVDVTESADGGARFEFHGAQVRPA